MRQECCLLQVKISDTSVYLAQDLLFNLIASFRVFLTIQQQPPTDEPTI